MQTVLDNMSDGVTLWDKDFRWQFSNRMHIHRQRYTADLLRGADGYDMVRFQAQRGEYGPLDGQALEDKVQEIVVGDPRSEGRPLRAPHAWPGATSSSPTTRWRTAACSASIATSPT